MTSRTAFHFMAATTVVSLKEIKRVNYQRLLAELARDGHIEMAIDPAQMSIEVADMEKRQYSLGHRQTTVVLGSHFRRSMLFSYTLEPSDPLYAVAHERLASVEKRYALYAYVEQNRWGCRSHHEIALATSEWGTSLHILEDNLRTQFQMTMEGYSS